MNSGEWEQNWSKPLRIIAVKKGITDLWNDCFIDWLISLLCSRRTYIMLNVASTWTPPPQPPPPPDVIVSASSPGDRHHHLLRCQIVRHESRVLSPDLFMGGNSTLELYHVHWSDTTNSKLLQLDKHDGLWLHNGRSRPTESVSQLLTATTTSYGLTRQDKSFILTQKHLPFECTSTQ